MGKKTEGEALDFGNLDSKAVAESGAILELNDPRNDDKLLDPEGKSYWIEILGLDSAKLRAVARKITDRRMTNIRRGKETEYDSEIVEAEKAQLYAAATKSWSLPPLDGQQLECNEKNAKRLYSDSRFPWLVEQIDKAIADRQRFFKTASPS